MIYGGLLRVPPLFTSTGLDCNSTRLCIPVSSVVEEFKVMPSYFEKLSRFQGCWSRDPNKDTKKVFIKTTVNQTDGMLNV